MATLGWRISSRTEGISEKNTGVKSARPSAAAARVVAPRKKLLWWKLRSYSGLQYSALPMATMWTISTFSYWSALATMASRM